MKYTIPFLYEAHIVKPRCRNLTPMLLQDAHEIIIPDMAASGAPVAYTKTCDDGSIVETRAFNDALWEPVKSNGTPIYVTSIATAVTKLFDQSWRSLPSTDYLPVTAQGLTSGIHTARDVTEGVYKVEIPYREWCVDNKRAMIDKLNRMAESYIFIDGELHTQAAEPYYFVRTFGLGNNHGGTSLLSGSYWTPESDCDIWFGLDQYAEAVEYAERIARERGDDETLSIEQNAYTLRMPEVLKYADKSIKPTPAQATLVMPGAAFSW